VLELKTIAIRDDGCFSVLLWDGQPFAVSVERTFDDGRPVIGAGDHVCRRSFYIKGGYETFEIEVPGHDRVLFHKGNTEMDSIACVAVAESFAVMNGVTAVQDSKHGFEELMERAAGLDSFMLRVTGR
jgi:hypothetical protein